ncbi:hypothetical protein Tco_0793889 [Tanacetum coccineum]
MLLMEAKEKGVTLDAEAEAFLANVECTAPYDQPLAMATTNIFEVNHEDAYDSDVDEGPNAAAAFMANLSSTSGNNHHVNEVHPNAIQINDSVNYQLSHEMHHEEQSDSDVESELDDNTTPYHQLELERRAKVVPTEVSTGSSANISMVTILDEMRDTLDEKTQENQDLSLENQNLKAEIAKCKLEIVRLDTQQVKLDLERQVRQEQNLVTQRNARNAELEQEKVMLKTHLKSKDISIEFLKSKNQKVLTDKKKLEDKYLDEIYGFYEKLNAMMFVPQKELSREQVYWLPANEIASQASTPSTPVTPYVPKSPPPSQVLATLHNIKQFFPQFHAFTKKRTIVKPLYVSLPCYEYAKEFALQQVVPFLDYFKKHVQTADDTIVKEVAEFKEIHYALEDEYEQLKITIVCSIVLTSDIVVPPSSNCLCEELRSNCDREHSKVVELEAEILKKQQMLNESEKRCAFIEKNHVNLQVKFQKYKECLQNQMVCDNTNSTTSNEIFEINKLKDQLQGKDDTIRNLQTQINITRMLNVGSTVGSFDKQALETELTQLKDALTSVRIQIDGYKAENVNLKRRYEELLKSNAYSRSTFTAKINALTAENAKLKTELSGKKSSGSTASEKPKVLASGMYTNSSKYVPPPKRANWVKPTPLPKKKQVTFQEPPRTSNRPTQKPPVQQNKKPNVSVNLSTRTKPATESRKPMPKSHTQNHRILPSKSVNARRAADHNRKLNVVDHNQFVIRSLKSVNTKTPQAKHSVNHTKKVWKATRNHNVNTTKTACVTTERFCWYVEASVETH